MPDSDVLVRIGGLEFSGQGTHRTRTGFFIRDQGLTGWHDGVSFRSDRTGLLARPGTLVGNVQPEGRVIPLAGPAIASSQPELLAMRDQFRELFRTGTERIEVQHSGRTEWCDVERLEQPEFSPLYYLNRANYRLAMYAPDPFIFGTARRYTGTGQSLAVSHRGSWDAAPTVTVRAATAMTSGYGLRLLDGSETRGFLRVNSAGAGVRHVIRPDLMEVRTTSGALLIGALHSGEPWSVPPNGEFTVRVEPVTGTGVVESMQIVDTYL
ncbi:hypothetical protein GCM10011490_24290 [Pseudoclavibacter endophyticus]|uniref:Phage tail family protein n=1 Tax=Pseudoclavibacter endophyticus TaxID=1778590 RepID=A0A6H9WCL2_9MICO|nr:hypothetical protein [Pseudoclavibacter endophyticus]KAB1648430.1 hypothetical protein F8O04_12150 [Pseudoclavibacter endophyticus]GGA72655.1 hypothetical protein GCM10011490_24290 [Pseudoclavibacter endophyticus]